VGRGGDAVPAADGAVSVLVRDRFCFFWGGALGWAGLGSCSVGKSVVSSK